MLVKDAKVIWNTLRGIVCVYKPADVGCRQVRNTIIYKICSELNEMHCRPPIKRVEIEVSNAEEYSVKVVPNLADHVNVVGPRYQQEDLVCSWANYLGRNTSGVLLFGLRDATKTAKFIRENKPTRAYRVKGRLGLSTDTAFKVGRPVERTTWKHVKYVHLETLLSSMQAAHQRKMFELCGVDMQSQLAYELAVKGPIRPVDSKIPVLYGIKCVDFNPPDFTLEIHCINEYETYLMHLIHEVGMKLHSSAHCTGIQCIRHGCFTLDDALLRKHWTLQEIVSNVEHCNRLLEENKFIVKQENAALQQIQ
ncbi:mitochondrial mRNA pseudouridine synthase Trub2 [Coccinella septempunctata]|uniref:mitochondrial mRNA pseudouridine synthase Trub2 n=1 Tax=Coccinella septempunctata TaxID=41139 RepID=UPI001D05D5F0|nr:mitochondrial mRNA pseudouridine synthase Trub2 [Coccinella septempunctata]